VILLKDCKLVVTLDYGKPLLRNEDILIENGFIAGIGIRDKSGEVISCNNLIVMPALINSFVRLEDPIKELRKELAVKSLKLFLVSSLISGVSTIFSPLSRLREDALGIIKEIGLRLIPAGCNSQVVLIKFKDLLHNNAESFRCREECLKVIDVALTRRELFKVKNTTGLFPIEFIDEKGVMDENTIIVSPSWITNREIALLAERRAKVIVCPGIEMYSGLGSFTPLKDILEGGVKVGLGTYDPLFNLNMFEEAKLLLMYYRYNYWDMLWDELKTLRLASLEGYRLFGINSGMVKEGMVANLIGIDIGSTLADLREIVNTFRGPVSFMMVVGNVISGDEISKFILEKRILTQELNNRLDLTQ